MEAAAATETPATRRSRVRASAGDRPRLDAGPAVRILDARGAPERLGGAWSDLAACAAEPNIFAESWFVGAGLKHLAFGQGVRLIEVWKEEPEASPLLGLLLVVIKESYGRLPVRHVRNWTHFHSFLGTPLVRAGEEIPFWTAALAALDKARWAPNFLHLKGLVDDGPVLAGLRVAAEQDKRACDIVHRSERALLESRLSPELYYESIVRKKKRKELKRLAGRLAERGEVRARILADAAELEGWCDDFLALERSGWKGTAGSALMCRPETELFFRDVVACGFEAGRLNFLRLDLDGRPLAMLVNFIAPPGAFSFKIAFDESYARFSPGVLIQLENLKILGRDDVIWMDSCAAQDHSMINSLWAERRSIVRVTIALAGARRRAVFRFSRMAENLSAALRHFRQAPHLDIQEGRHDG